MPQDPQACPAPSPPWQELRVRQVALGHRRSLVAFLTREVTTTAWWRAPPLPPPPPPARPGWGMGISWDLRTRGQGTCDVPWWRATQGLLLQRHTHPLTITPWKWSPEPGRPCQRTRSLVIPLALTPTLPRPRNFHCTTTSRGWSNALLLPRKWRRRQCPIQSATLLPRSPSPTAPNPCHLSYHTRSTAPMDPTEPTNHSGSIPASLTWLVAGMRAMGRCLMVRLLTLRTVLMACTVRTPHTDSPIAGTRPWSSSLRLKTPSLPWSLCGERVRWAPPQRAPNSRTLRSMCRSFSWKRPRSWFKTWRTLKVRIMSCTPTLRLCEGEVVLSRGRMTLETRMPPTISPASLMAARPPQNLARLWRPQGVPPRGRLPRMLRQTRWARSDWPWSEMQAPCRWRMLVDMTPPPSFPHRPRSHPLLWRWRSACPMTRPSATPHGCQARGRRVSNCDYPSHRPPAAGGTTGTAIREDIAAPTPAIKKIECQEVIPTSQLGRPWAATQGTGLCIAPPLLPSLTPLHHHPRRSLALHCRSRPSTVGSPSLSSSSPPLCRSWSSNPTPQQTQMGWALGPLRRLPWITCTASTPTCSSCLRSVRASRCRATLTPTFIRAWWTPCTGPHSRPSLLLSLTTPLPHHPLHRSKQVCMWVHVPFVSCVQIYWVFARLGGCNIPSLGGAQTSLCWPCCLILPCCPLWAACGQCQGGGGGGGGGLSHSATDVWYAGFKSL